jgi:predicted enzyme related to lactoylglutathione lyase
MYSPNSLGADELAGRQTAREAQTMKPFVGWFEITGKDGPAPQRFYSNLFAWSINEARGGSGCGLVEAGEKRTAGGIGASQGGEQGGVTFYVEAGDPAAFSGRAERLRGKTVVPSTKIPDSGLTFAFFADPDGHVVGLSGGAVQ